MENKKHTKFESLIKEQFENHEIDYNQDDWLDFENRYSEELSFSKSKNFNIKDKIDLKSLMIYLAIVTNLIIIILFITTFSKNSTFYADEAQNERFYYSHRKVNPEIKFYTAENETQKNDDIKDLKQKFNEFEYLITSLIKISQKTENSASNQTIINNITEKTITLDTIQLSENKEEIGFSDEKITYQKDIDDLYSIVATDQKPMFKDKRGNFHYIEDLEKYIMSEFQPSNLKEKIYGDFTIYLMFTITKEGEIKDIEPLRNINADIEKEAMRIIGGMPDWKPAEIQGEKVGIITSITINISIEKLTPFPKF